MPDVLKPFTLLTSFLAQPRRARLLGIVAVLAALLAGAGTIGSRPTQAQPSPTDSLLGQHADTCKSGHTFSVDVTGAELSASLDGKSAGPGSAWLVVIVNATNTGAESGDFYMALAVADEQGRKFGFRSPGSAEEIDLAGVYGVETPFTPLDGGTSLQTYATFQVPANATSFTLIGDPIQCS